MIKSYFLSEGLLYSILFELLLCLALPMRVVDAVAVVVNVLVHLCIHVIGIHILITTQVRSLFKGRASNCVYLGWP